MVSIVCHLCLPAVSVLRLDYSQKVLLDTLPQGAPPGLLSALFGECSAALAGRSVIFLAPACLPSRDN